MYLKFKQLLGLSLIIGISALSCQNSYDHNSYRDYRFVHTIPDSLRTDEDKVILRKLVNIIVNDYEVKNNNVKLKSSKDDFKNQGIPIAYYYKINEDLDELNKYVNAIDTLDMKVLIDSLKEDMRRLVIE